METNHAVAALAALAAVSRLEIYRLLVRAGPAGMSAGSISDATGIPPSSLSFHLKELSHAQLAMSRQEGRYVIYSANFVAMKALLGYLTEHCCEGQPCGLPDTPTCITDRPSR